MVANQRFTVRHREFIRDFTPVGEDVKYEDFSAQLQKAHRQDFAGIDNRSIKKWWTKTHIDGETDTSRKLFGASITKPKCRVSLAIH